MAWYRRNKDKLTLTNDPVLAAIKNNKIDPCTSLEIGCGAYAYRVEAMQEMGFDAWGLDPAISTIEPAPISLSWPGTASNLGLFHTAKFNLVIYGWCLYLTDPEDHFVIAAEGDRVLRDGGHLIIYDFHSEFPYKRPYKHLPGLFSHKCNFAKMWLGHPAYTVASRNIYGAGEDETMVTVLKKDLLNAFPVKE